MKTLWTITENKPWESRAEIVKEAKTAVSMKTTLTKTVQTKRPNTPKEPTRSLLGHQAQGYDVFSLKQLKFQEQLPLIQDLQMKKKAYRSPEKVKLPSIIAPKPPDKTMRIHCLAKLSEEDDTFTCCADDTNAKKDNVINETIAYETTLDFTIKALSKLNPTDDSSSIVKLLDQLNEIVEKQYLSNNINEDFHMKSRILKCVNRFIEVDNDFILLKIAIVILNLNVTGLNISSVSKLIFKIARNDQNDVYFQQTKVLSLFVNCLGCATPLEDAEALVYGYGAIKFLTLNSKLLDACLNLGILQLMVLHLRMLNLAKTELVPIPEQTSHGIFQLTGALRNIASVQDKKPLLAECGAITELCKCAALFSGNTDLVTNLVRNISIVSNDKSCSQVILNYPSIMSTFFQILKKYPGREDIVVRLTYALGNLAADDNSARIQIASEKDSIQTLVELLEIYLAKDVELMTRVKSSDGKKDKDRDNLIEDVLIKIVRIIANLSLNNSVGKQLTSSSLEKNASERILNVLLSCIRYKNIYESEELLLVTLTTLNNLTFYTQTESQSDSPFSKRTLEIAQALSTLMLITQKDCLIEIARVYGNLSRSEEVRNYLVDTRALNHLMKWLDQDDRELKLTTVGVMVNTMPDEDKRNIFKQDKGLEKFLSILEETKQTRDWEMGCLICQGIWNYMIDSNDIVHVCGENNTFMLIDLLITLLDEDNLTESDQYEEWEKFAHVGTNLLEKIETFFETNPLLETKEDEP